MTTAPYGKIDHRATATPPLSRAGVISGPRVITNGQVVPVDVGSLRDTHQTVMDRIYDS